MRLQTYINQKAGVYCKCLFSRGTDQTGVEDLNSRISKIYVIGQDEQVTSQRSMNFKIVHILLRSGLICSFPRLLVLSSICIYTLLVWVFVCLYPIKVKTALNLTGPNFVWRLTWPQGRFMYDQNFKYQPPTKFDFLRKSAIRKLIFCFSFTM